MNETDHNIMYRLLLRAKPSPAATSVVMAHPKVETKGHRALMLKSCYG